MAGKGMTELQKAWIAYLRAHPDQQTDGCLMRTNGTMCCLGAAAKLMIDGNVVRDFRWLEPVQPAGGDIFTLQDYHEHYSDDVILPEPLWRALGLNGPYGEFFENGEQVAILDHCSLVQLNDSGFTWPQIADVIEANPEMVFANCGAGK